MSKKPRRIANWIVFTLMGSWVISALALVFFPTKTNWIFGIFLILTGTGLLVLRPVGSKRDRIITQVMSFLAFAAGVFFITTSITNGFN